MTIRSLFLLCVLSYLGSISVYAQGTIFPDDVPAVTLGDEVTVRGVLNPVVAASPDSLGKGKAQKIYALFTPYKLRVSTESGEVKATVLQLVGPEELAKKLWGLKVSTVEAVGRIVPATSPYHRTEFVLELRSINRLR
ncbi:MAG: hypothetical protein HRU46_13815 [Verrucomicrobiales bacterium]|nr:hypothetical protein [Verrucomicrobiales bacterium]